jgi:peptidyl-prolyl cis-trans isomerase D
MDVLPAATFRRRVTGDKVKMALGFMRRHRGWLNWFLVLIIAAFILLYVPAFLKTDTGAPGEVLADVGGMPITRGEFDRAYQRQRQAYERMYQGRLDPAMLRGLGLEQQTLQGLVSQRLIALEAKRLGLRVDDETVAQRLATAPEFQRDGRFVGAAEIRRLLDMQRISVEEFEVTLRDRILAEQLEALVTDGVSVTPAEAEQEFRRRTEQVKIEYVLADASKFREGQTVSDDEVKARFDSAKDTYRLPERRILSYALADATALASRVAVTDRDIESYYQGHRDEFKQEEEACASHILIKVKQGEAKEGHADEEAKKVAQELLDQVKAGKDFAELAKKSSEDQGSAAQGGSLGCFGRGRMVPEFENAAFSLGAGETSDLVKSPFGYHIIRVTERKDETFAPLAQVKERIRQTMLADRARTLAEEKMRGMSEELRRGKSLDEAAGNVGLSVQKSAPLERGKPAPPLASPALLAKAFELRKGEVAKEPFALPTAYAFIALDEIQPSRIPELKDVQARVRADLVQEKALARARELAAQVRTRAEKEGLDKAASALGLVRKETPALVGRGQPLAELGSAAALEEAAYSLPEKTLSEPVRAAGGYAVIRVLEKKPFDPAAFEKEKPSITTSLRGEKKQQLFQAFLAQARQRYKVDENRPAMQRAVAG